MHFTLDYELQENNIPPPPLPSPQNPNKTVRKNQRKKDQVYRKVPSSVLSILMCSLQIMVLCSLSLYPALKSVFSHHDTV